MSALPFDALPNWSSPYVLDGMPEGARGAREADARAISPGYLAAVGATLIAGRDFDEGDGPGKAPVVIVDDRLADAAWPGQDTLGRRLQVQFLDPATGFTPTWATVIGVVAHSVARRRREIGVRLALGAAARDVIRAVLGEGLSLAVAGLGLGLLAAVALTRAARGVLFGVGPLDPATYAGVGAVLAATAVLASALPAWRASRTDPTEVLRAE